MRAPVSCIATASVLLVEGAPIERGCPALSAKKKPLPHMRFRLVRQGLQKRQAD
jgi:hypothetical protein